MPPPAATKPDERSRLVPPISVPDVPPSPPRKGAGMFAAMKNLSKLLPEVSPMSKATKNKAKHLSHLKYNPADLLQFKVVTQIRGTVMFNGGVWKMIVGLFVVAIITGGLVWSAVPQPQNLDTRRFFELVMYFKVFIAFMLGMYMGNCFNRWWNCCVMLTDFFLVIRKMSWLANATNVSAAETEQLTRWMLLSSYLLENEVTTQWVTKPDIVRWKWASLMNDMASSGLIEPDEERIVCQLEHENRASAIWSWIGVHVNKFDIIPPTRAYFMELTGEASGLIKGVKFYAQSQLPFMYCHMLAMLVHVTNIVMGISCGIASAVYFGEFVEGWRIGTRESLGLPVPEHAVPATATMYMAVQGICLQIFGLIVQPLLYHAFLEIASTLCDPFTSKAIATPFYMHIDEVKEQMRELNDLAKDNVNEIDDDNDLEDMPGWERVRNLTDLMSPAGMIEILRKKGKLSPSTIEPYTYGSASAQP